ncbi:hypothetical protein [Lacipirellula limnantheis]|uniref:Uncharacterized protein n=1 Tax=Lacipirellula limnantheis TaxID=2528024 RepID=A0A517TTI6_9BACT|nr:hypothetical protein [Lacipirellula limnantheis]QDT71691.1 hypothetical protein I41_08510 [Lacipirellula limnantheis]
MHTRAWLVSSQFGAQDIELAGLSTEGTVTLGKALAAIEADPRKRLAAITLADLRAAKAA